MIAHAYRDFLAAKVVMAGASGFDVEDSEIHPSLKPVQRAAVRWALHGGRRALFKAFGLGKTRDQLEILRLILVRTGGRALIVAPLGVRQEFRREAEAMGYGVTFIRRIEEAGETGLYITNYETVRDGKLDPRQFAAASLDEAACLRAFGGSKTFREFMRLFEGIRFKFVATATPSPNEYIEILAYSAFLEIMDVGQAKTRFFKRNAEKADTLTIHPHKEREFWLWVASWALFVSKPSDLGFDDAGYALPPLDVRWHEVPVDYSHAGSEVNGQGRLLPRGAVGVLDASHIKWESLPARIAKMMEIIEDGRSAARLHERVSRKEQGSADCEEDGTTETVLSEEQDIDQGSHSRLARSEPGTLQGTDEASRRKKPEDHQRAKREVVPGEPRARPAARAAAEAETIRADTSGVRADAGFPEGSVCRLPERDDVTQGGSLPHERSSSGPVVHEVQQRTRDVRGRSSNDHSSSGLPDQIIVWCDLNIEQRTIESNLSHVGISVTSLCGSQSIDDREDQLEAWKSRDTSVLLTKPSMYGAGVNLQQCHTMVFAGIGFKFAEFIQAIHRVHRFMQPHPVRIDIIYSEAEQDVRRRLERRWRQHNDMVVKMGEIIREFGLSEIAMAQALQRSMGVERVEVLGETYRLVNNDSVEEVRSMAPDSVDLIVTSIPFSTQYEYSPNYADFGHTDDNAHFWRQMDFLTPELLRVLKPGRNAVIHVKDRIQPGGLTGLGFQTVEPFSDECAAHFRRHGWAFLARKTIVTDVVRENNQTYRLGWTEQCKDGTRMGAGMPEYLLVFRKPPSDRSDGYADNPVRKSKPLVLAEDGAPVPWRDKGLCVPGTGYSRGRWQFDAHGFMRSSGDRLLRPEDLDGLNHKEMFRTFRRFSLDHVYDFEHHVRIAEHIEERGRLPVTFMLFPPQSHHPDVWTDVARMRTMNGLQAQHGREMHLCPLQFDVADRVIAQMSEPGETVFDPFAGLGTVPYCAVKQGRRGLGVELSPAYFVDSFRYLEAAAREMATPSLFDLLGLRKAEDSDADPLPIELEAAE